MRGVRALFILPRYTMTASTLRSAALLLTTTLGPLAAQHEPHLLAFVDVHVVPMDRERVIENQTVIVADGVIRTIGPTDQVEIPDEATRIEGNGRYLLPGLAEMHGHIQTRNSFAPSRWPEDMLFLYLANGVTTVRGMLGEEIYLRLREVLRKGTVLGPRITVACPMLSGKAAPTPDDGERLVREAVRTGYDFLKIHEGLSVETYDAITATARQLGIPYGGHVPDAVGFFHAVRAGQRSIDHLDNMFDAVDGDATRIPELVAAVQENPTWVVPTEVLWETTIILHEDPEVLAAERPELKYVPVALAGRWALVQSQNRKAVTDEAPGRRRQAFRRELLRQLAEADARILFGTDSPQIFSVPGFSIHREITLLREVGMTPFQILASATTAPAAYFEDENSGTIAEGRRADLVLVDANPLEDLGCLRTPAGVVAAGRWLPRDEIDRRLAEIAAAYER